MPISDHLRQALELARSGEVEQALELLLEGSEEPDEQAQGFVFLLLQARNELEKACKLADRCISAASTEADRSLWLMRRGLLWLERDDKMRALVDLNQVLRIDANEDHVAQARRAMARTLDPDPPRDILSGERRYRS